MISLSQIFWILFLIFILGAVIFDLFLMERRKKELSLKEAAFWTGIWISLAFLFNLLIYFFFGSEKALEYFTAYLLEKSLSLDNLFVFLIIFSFFDLSLLSQQKVLKWGILGAFLMRAIFIFGGIYLLKSFHFLFYVFGAFLIYSGMKLLFQKEMKIDPQKNLFLRIVRRITKVTEDMKDSRFFVREPALTITPLFVSLILIESSDLVFATDSVPAVLAITQDPFIAYTSNAFAILGLRALYFVLANLLPRFIYLKSGIIILLTFIGFKMIIHQFLPIPITFSLAFILITIAISILLSLIKARKKQE
jgi:tellurite resistance protein TerC